MIFRDKIMVINRTETTNTTALRRQRRLVGIADEFLSTPRTKKIMFLAQRENLSLSTNL